MIKTQPPRPQRKGSSETQFEETPEARRLPGHRNPTSLLLPRRHDFGFHFLIFVHALGWLVTVCVAGDTLGTPVPFFCSAPGAGAWRAPARSPPQGSGDQPVPHFLLFSFHASLKRFKQGIFHNCTGDRCFPIHSIQRNFRRRSGHPVPGLKQNSAMRNKHSS